MSTTTWPPLHEALINLIAQYRYTAIQEICEGAKDIDNTRNARGRAYRKVADEMLAMLLKHTLEEDHKELKEQIAAMTCCLVNT